MPRWGIINGKVRELKKGMKTKIEYTGTYESACYFFEQEPEDGKNLLDIVITHNLTGNGFITKTSAELYDIMIEAMKKKKYFIPVEKRHDVAMRTLIEAEEKKLIFDDKIIENLEGKEVRKEWEDKRLWKIKRFLPLKAQYMEELNL